MTDHVLSDPLSDAVSLPEHNPREEAWLALFGHDLRAALSDVVGGLRLIDPEPLDVLTRAQVDRVRVSAEGLAQLLDRGLAELLGGGPTPAPAHVDLQRYLTDVDLRWSGRGLETGTGFDLQCADSLPAQLQADWVTLDRVVSNLIGNAFKYAARGRIGVEVVRRADGGVRLAVRDDGPGFPQRVLDGPLVFHHRSAGATGPGSGLGLPIVADLLHRLGGQLTLRNRATGGAEAVVDLPPELSAHGPLCETRKGPLLAGWRVLVADDNPTSQAIATGLLTVLGADVVAAGDGIEALGRLEAGGIDLLLVDVQMPRMSGLDVIRSLRKLPGAAGRLPVVAVTAQGLPSDRRALLAVGADEVLTKPLVCPHAIANALSDVLDRCVAQLPRGDAGAAGVIARVEPVQEPIAEPAFDPVFDGDRLQRLLEMAGPETGRELLDRLVSDLDSVRQGLTDAMPGPDWGAIRDHSHVLISLAGAVGGLHLQAGAETLNQVAHRFDGTLLNALMPRVLVDLTAMIASVDQTRRSHVATA